MDTWQDELPTGTIFQPRVLADLFAALVSRNVHLKNRVLAVYVLANSAAALAIRMVSSCFNIDTSRSDHFGPDPPRNVAGYDIHNSFLQT